MIHKSRIMIICLLAALSIPSIQAAHAQAVQTGSLADKAKKIDDLMNKYYERGLFQGSALVAMHGEVVYKKSFGLANMEWNIPNTTQTKYRIASLGKSFTAAIILQLMEEGRLDLHTPISKYLPAYRKDAAERVTIHHLLSHTSGVPSVPQEWKDHQYRHPYTVAELVELANQGDLEFEPGTKFSYSNNGYNLLGAIIQNLMGKPFAEVLQERILDRLGMSDTGLVLGHDRIIKHLAMGYNRLQGNKYENAPYMDKSFAVGAGGMYSTLDDMFKWDQALYGNELLSDNSKKLMFASGLGNAGYGWNVGRYVKADRSLHTLVTGAGGTSGFASVIFRLINDRHLIVLLGNIRQIPQGQIASNITNILVDLPVNPIPPPTDSEPE